MTFDEFCKGLGLVESPFAGFAAETDDKGDGGAVIYEIRDPQSNFCD